MSDYSHMDARVREANERLINSIHELAEINERMAAAAVKNNESYFQAAAPSTPPRYEYRRQPGTLENDYQPVAPGPDWDLHAWMEDSKLTAYLWSHPVAANS